MTGFLYYAHHHFIDDYESEHTNHTGYSYNNYEPNQVHVKINPVIEHINIHDHFPLMHHCK